MFSTKKQTSGINKSAFLQKKLFEKDKLKQIPLRNGYGDGLVKAGKQNDNIVGLCADLTESTRMLAFKETFPERFVEMGVAEQSMVSVASGMALTGKIPFISSYAVFSPGRNWEQIRTCVCLQNANVKIIGSHAGVSVGEDGATHQMTEDIALMRVLPNMTVILPCDSKEAEKSTLTLAQKKGPAYLRLAREKSPVFTTDKTPFVLGKAEIYRFGNDIALIGAGPILYEALLAAEKLSQEGIEACVVNCHTIKPLDKKTLVAIAKQTRAVVTLEEAQIAGGLGGAICELLCQEAPVPVERIGMPDCFGESGKPEELLQGFGLTSPFIVLAAKRVLNRKAGKKVSVVSEHLALAQKKFTQRKKEVLEKSLSQTPKKWK